MFPENDCRDSSIVTILCTCSVLTRFDEGKFADSMAGIRSDTLRVKGVVVSVDERFGRMWENTGNFSGFIVWRCRSFDWYICWNFRFILFFKFHVLCYVVQPQGGRFSYHNP